MPFKTDLGVQCYYLLIRIVKRLQMAFLRRYAEDHNPFTVCHLKIITTLLIPDEILASLQLRFDDTLHHVYDVHLSKNQLSATYKPVSLHFRLIYSRAETFYCAARDYQCTD